MQQGLAHLPQADAAERTEQQAAALALRAAHHAHGGSDTKQGWPQSACQIGERRLTQTQTLAAEIERVTALRAEWATLGQQAGGERGGYRVTVNLSGAIQQIDADLERARVALQTDDDAQRAIEIGTLKKWKS